MNHNQKQSTEFAQMPNVKSLKVNNRILFKESVYVKKGKKNEYMGDRYSVCEVMGKGGMTNSVLLNTIKSTGYNPHVAGKKITRPIKNVMVNSRELMQSVGDSVSSAFEKGGANMSELAKYAIHEEKGLLDVYKMPQFPKPITTYTNAIGVVHIYLTFITTMEKGKFVKNPVYSIGKGGNQHQFSKLKYVLRSVDKKEYDRYFNEDGELKTNSKLEKGGGLDDLYTDDIFSLKGHKYKVSGLSTDNQYAMCTDLGTNAKEQIRVSEIMKNGGSIEYGKSGGFLVGKKDGKIIMHNDADLGGFLVGRRHSEDGIKGVNESTGQSIEVEGEELVIHNDAVNSPEKKNFNGKMMTNREILSYLNKEGGGVSFASGGNVETELGGGNVVNSGAGNPIKYDGGEVILTRGAVASGAKYDFGGKQMTTRQIASAINQEGGGVSFDNGGKVYDKKIYLLSNDGHRDSVTLGVVADSINGLIRLLIHEEQDLFGHTVIEDTIKIDEKLKRITYKYKEMDGDIEKGSYGFFVAEVW